MWSTAARWVCEVCNGVPTGETLARGPSYDLEVMALDGQRQEEAEAADGSPAASARRTLTAG